MYHHKETTKKSFLGKTLNNIARIDESTVKISFGDGEECILDVEGDCCSHSIFYEIDFPEPAKGGVITDLDESGYGDSKSTSTVDSEEVATEKVKALFPDFYIECLSIWNVVFSTSKGDVIVRHINSSNGYYDGMTGYKFN